MPRAGDSRADGFDLRELLEATSFCVGSGWVDDGDGDCDGDCEGDCDGDRAIGVDTRELGALIMGVAFNVLEGLVKALSLFSLSCVTESFGC